MYSNHTVLHYHHCETKGNSQIIFLFSLEMHQLCLLQDLWKKEEVELLKDTHPFFVKGDDVYVF